MKIDQVFDRIRENKEKIEFMPTGLKQIDEFLDGGFLRKELVVLGGFTGSGKSYLAGQILRNVAQSGFKSCYLSLEISNEMIVSRLIGQNANIKPTKLLVGSFTDQEYKEMLRSKAEVSVYSELMDFFDDIYLFEDIVRQIKVGGYEFVVIDFVQNIISSKNDEYERLSDISIKLQQLAKECNCCIFVLSQLSNSAFKEGRLEFKGSGSIATVCDLGIFIERDFGDDKENPDKNSVKISIRKNRRGISGVFWDAYMRDPGGEVILK